MMCKAVFSKSIFNILCKKKDELSIFWKKKIIKLIISIMCLVKTKKKNAKDKHVKFWKNKNLNIENFVSFKIKFYVKKDE